jgi:hypothetical protein
MARWVHCHAGCNQDRVIDALKAKGLWPEQEQSDVIEASYDYTDERGRLLYQIVHKPGKKFLERYHGCGGWMKRAKGATLAEIMKATGGRACWRKLSEYLPGFHRIDNPAHIVVHANPKPLVAFAAHLFGHACHAPYRDFMPQSVFMRVGSTPRTGQYPPDQRYRNGMHKQRRGGFSRGTNQARRVLSPTRLGPLLVTGATS